MNMFVGVISISWSKYNQSKFFFEDGFATLNGGWHIPEDDIISNCPHGPTHCDHNFHVEMQPDSILETNNDLEEISVRFDGKIQRAPSS
jgi:hypothetical protein